ncbi:MAG: DUF6732 family protein [Pseudomonadota bacterium]
MRHLLFLSAALFLPAAAQAHSGHLGTLGGHDHWVLGVGLGVIVAGAVAGWVKGRKTEPEATAEDADASEDQPA